MIIFLVNLIFLDGKKTQRTVLAALIKSFGGTLFVSAVLRLVNDILLYLTPQVHLWALLWDLTITFYCILNFKSICEHCIENFELHYFVSYTSSIIVGSVLRLVNANRLYLTQMVYLWALLWDLSIIFYCILHHSHRCICEKVFWDLSIIYLSI